MGTIVQFNPKRRHPSESGFALAMIIALLAVIGVVAYLKYWRGPSNSLPNIVSAFLEPQTLIGRASIIDGDTIEIHNTQIRLFGTDASEGSQLCTIGGKSYRFGAQAAFELSNKIGSHVVECRPKDRDRYGRVVAVCLSGGDDLNGWMVAQGWALTYRQHSLAYVDQEKIASSAKLVMWQGGFARPWDWRHSQSADLPPQRSAPSAVVPRILSADEFVREGRTAPRATQPTGCTIKGNISARGERIYHVPGGAFYSRTVISPDKGERWFCSEADARAAGWRRSLR